MFRVARRAARLSDGLVNDGDDGVVGDASFSWTVVIHDVAETQRALLHSVLPTGLHCRFALKCADPVFSGPKFARARSFPETLPPGSGRKCALAGHRRITTSDGLRQLKTPRHPVTSTLRITYRTTGSVSIQRRAASSARSRPAVSASIESGCVSSGMTPTPSRRCPV